MTCSLCAGPLTQGTCKPCQDVSCGWPTEHPVDCLYCAAGEAMVHTYEPPVQDAAPRTVHDGTLEEHLTHPHWGRLCMVGDWQQHAGARTTPPVQDAAPDTGPGWVGCTCDAIDGDHDRPGCGIYVRTTPMVGNVAPDTT